MTNTTLRGKLDVGNTYVRFDEGKVASKVKILLMSLLAAASAQAVSNKDWYVSDDMQYGREYEPKNCTNDLQYAVNKCTAGYTVWVKDGFVWNTGAIAGGKSNYRLSITSSITVRSESGFVDEALSKGVKIVGAYQSADTPCGDDSVGCVYAVASKGVGVTLVGFVLENGCTKSWSGSVGEAGQTGGGVKGSATTVVSNCVIRGCHGGRGSATVSGNLCDCVITNNGSGHCAVLYPVTVAGCKILDNATRGVGNISAAQPCVITNTVIAGNVISDVGAGLYQYSGDQSVTLYDCVLSNNTSTSKYGAGIAGRDSGTTARPVLYHCTIADNTLKHVSGSHGGAGAAYSILYDCKIAGNTAAGGESGGGMSQCTAYRTQIFGNTASYCGGGAYNSTLYNCVVSNNVVDGTSPYCDGGGTHGCEVYNCLVCNNSSCSLTGGMSKGVCAVNCTVTGNKTTGSYGGVSSVPMVVNTISYGNTPNADFGGSWTNSCSPGITGAQSKSGVVSTDPRLDANFYPHARACKNSGVTFDWMTDADDVRSKDLAGKARIVGEKPDMGAFECPPIGLMLLLR